MAEGSYRIVQCGSRGHGGLPDTGHGVDWRAEVVCPRRVKQSARGTEIFPSSARRGIPHSALTNFAGSTQRIAVISIRVAGEPSKSAVEA